MKYKDFKYLYESDKENLFSNLKTLVTNARYYKTLKREIERWNKCDLPLEEMIDILEEHPAYSKNNFTEYYLDFNWYGMTLSLYPCKEGYFLGETIDMWNNETCANIGEYNNIDEVEHDISETTKYLVSQLRSLSLFEFVNIDNYVALNVAIECLNDYTRQINIM